MVTFSVLGKNEAELVEQSAKVLSSYYGRPVRIEPISPHKRPVRPDDEDPSVMVIDRRYFLDHTRCTPAAKEIGNPVPLEWSCEVTLPA